MKRLAQTVITASTKQTNDDEILHSPTSCLSAHVNNGRDSPLITNATVKNVNSIVTTRLARPKNEAFSSLSTELTPAPSFVKNAKTLSKIPQPSDAHTRGYCRQRGNHSETATRDNKGNDYCWVQDGMTVFNEAVQFVQRK